LTCSASLSPARRVVLAVGLVPVAITCVWGAVLFTSVVQGSRAYRFSAMQAATALDVQASNASLTARTEPGRAGARRGAWALRRAPSDRGPDQPRRAADDQRGVPLDLAALVQTCTWTWPCRPAFPVVARGDNGAIQAHDLTGALQLRTDDGAVDVSGARGVLQLQTSNGRSRPRPPRARRCRRSHDNGRIGLDFADAPTTRRRADVQRQVEIRVPDLGDLLPHHAHRQRLDSTPPCRAIASHRRTITARTDNGGIDIRRASVALSYSYCRASSGLSRAARRAGKIAAKDADHDGDYREHHQLRYRQDELDEVDPSAEQRGEISPDDDAEHGADERGVMTLSCRIMRRVLAAGSCRSRHHAEFGGCARTTVRTSALTYAEDAHQRPRAPAARTRR